MSSKTTRKHPKASRLRFLRAYSVTFEVLLNYFLLFLIGKIISKERFVPIMNRAHQRTSQTIINNILKLKGLYIKIGQTLSIMTNFLPKEFMEGFEKLQDAVPPHPYEDVEARFLADFGWTPKEMFASFNETPVASASLGQVHVAYLKDGTKLAVKLQYPDIDEIVRKDLKTIGKIFRLIDFLLPHYGFINVYHECSRMILEELDFHSEGKNLERIGENFKDNLQFHFPKVYWNLCSRKILTVEFVDGIKVSHVHELKKEGINPHDVAISLIHAYCKMIFVDGVYHADPHPGNIIVVPDSQAGYKIALVDFGATALIRPELKAGMILFIEGLIKKETRTLSTAMKQMGFIAREESEEAFDKIVDYFYGKIKAIKIEDFRDIKIANFQHLDDLLELKKMDVRFSDLTKTFHVPKDWILLERALILTMGLVTHLDAQLNPVDIVIPYVEQFILGKEKKLTDMILLGSKELILSYINLPTEIHKALRKLQEGKITLVDKSRKEQSERVYRAAHQLIYTLLLVFSGTMAYLLQKEGNLLWGGRLQYFSCFLGFVLGISFLKNRR